jgi:uncharacterized membrane protein YedE/YeeE
MTEFAPYSALAGGALIGLAAALMMLGIGRIAGVSGILMSVFTRQAGPIGWRVAFLAGMPVGALLVVALGIRDLGGLTFTANSWTVVVAGLLVGAGTTFGSGCTSGHGICGIARLSPRSIAATLAFKASGVATVFVVRHVF